MHDVRGALAMRLLLVEDDRLLARGIASALDEAGYAVDVAGSVGEATRAVHEADYEVGILDLGLPDGDGLELLRAWRSEGIDFPVLILSARGNLDNRVQGLDSGADDYLIKPFALREIEARLRALSRRPRQQAAWQQLGRLRFDRLGNRAFVDDREVELTRRELHVLGMLMSEAGRVVGKDDMMDAVYPRAADVAPNALELQVSRLRQKLRVACVNIRVLRGVGYRIEEVASHDDAEA